MNVSCGLIRWVSNLIWNLCSSGSAETSLWCTNWQRKGWLFDIQRGSFPQIEAEWVGDALAASTVRGQYTLTMLLKVTSHKRDDPSFFSGTNTYLIFTFSIWVLFFFFFLVTSTDLSLTLARTSDVVSETIQITVAWLEIELQSQFCYLSSRWLWLPGILHKVAWGNRRSWNEFPGVERQLRLALWSIILANYHLSFMLPTHPHKKTKPMSPS